MMDNLARLDMEVGFGISFVNAIMADGSAHIIEPLMAFLDQDDSARSIRPALRSLRPALVADIAHFASILHGRHPGVVDHAAHKIVDDAARKWLIAAIDGFSVERKYLNSLIVAAGPMRRQAGQDRITATFAQQSKSFEMLATSDRTGTPAGAALAIIVDWHQTRPLLDRASLLLNIRPPMSTLPSISYCQEVAENLGYNMAVKRAMGFGSEQLLAQQRGLWHLVVARHDELMGISR